MSQFRKLLSLCACHQQQHTIGRINCIASFEAFDTGHWEDVRLTTIPNNIKYGFAVCTYLRGTQNFFEFHNAKSEQDRTGS